MPFFKQKGLALQNSRKKEYVEVKQPKAIIPTCRKSSHYNEACKSRAPIQYVNSRRLYDCYNCIFIGLDTLVLFKCYYIFRSQAYKSDCLICVPLMTNIYCFK